MARAQKKTGKVAMGDMIKRLNKKYGMRVAHDLNEENPTEVKEWIPTGSRWLDSVICKGQMAGIPVGKITEIAGLSATGKSYLAVNIAANAQKMGHYVVYFDSESAIDPEFIRKAGIDTDPEKFMYVQAVTVEQVLEMMEEFIATEQQTLFIWDSIANTPTEADKEGDFNPNASVGKKARTLSLAFQKLTIPIANSQCTLLGLNQLKTVIASTHAQRMEALSEPYTTPGGKSMVYNASLRIWLTGRKAKSAFVKDENGFTIGSEVKEAGAWYSLVYEYGTTEKFQATRWMEKLEDPKFKSRVLELMDIEVIGKYRDRQGSIESFEDIDATVTES